MSNLKEMNKKKQHIAFAGGGTGGHVQPIVSLLEYAKEHNLDKETVFFWFGEKYSQEEHASKNIDYVRFVSISSGKLRRYRTIQSVFQNIRDIFKIFVGFFQSLYLLKKYNIDVLFCKGGYVALPVSLAGKFFGVKILMHESDMRAGLVNRIVSIFADKVFVAFSGVFPKKEIVVGQILSGQLGQRKDAEVQKKIHINTKKTIVLVMGGSQGSAKIFDTMLHILDAKKYKKNLKQGKNVSSCIQNMQFFVLLGTKNQKYKKQFDKYDNVWSFEFLSQQDLAYLYAISDIAVTRGSATSLEEQHIFGIKKIIIPLPFTGGNHQLYNAINYNKKYGDVLIRQDEKMKKNLMMFLNKWCMYKKTWKGVDEKILCYAKKTIRKNIRSFVC